MNLNKALKAKKKLLSQIEKAYNKFQKYNSLDKTKTAHYSAEKCYDEWQKLTNDLVELKSKITVANGPIYPKIFMMAELKNQISKMRSVSVNEGLMTISQGYGSSSMEVEYNCFINEKGRDEIIEAKEDLIETLQSEIETFNAITKI